MAPICAGHKFFSKPEMAVMVLDLRQRGELTVYYKIIFYFYFFQLRGDVIALDLSSMAVFSGS